MTDWMEQVLHPGERELVIVRFFDAPRELVFQAWTERERALQWWAPHGCTLTHLEMDVRPGGAWRKCMHSEDGTDYWRHGVYREVVPPERLVFTYVSDDPNSLPDVETLVTVTFEDDGGQTRMTLHQTLFDSVASRDAHHGGWMSSLDRLEALVTAGR